MNESFPFRLLIEPDPRTGAANMAVDEAILNSAVEPGICTLRFYRWIEPTVSLGYFQKLEEAAADPRLNGLPVVPRLSGGGAILHHHEWTYSCAVPARHPLASAPVRLYETIHAPIVEWLRERGIPAAMRGEASADSGVGRHDDSLPHLRMAEPFLCFGRGDPRDIVVRGMKVLGSAQRRRRGAILQHGSLLLRQSVHAPQFPGLREVADSVDVESELPGSLAARLAEVFKVQPGLFELTSAEKAFARV